MDWTRISPTLADVLDAYRFDEELFDRLVGELAAGRMGPASNRLEAKVEAPREGSWRSLPDAGSDERRELEEAGLEALRAGRVGAIILNGGMATRFGGVVKGAVEVFDGRSFLELKTTEIHDSGGPGVPIFLMNSFATHEATAELVAKLGLEGSVEMFPQGVMIRVTREGEIFFDARGEVSLYAPGHGDLVDALRRSGVLARFLSRGGEILTMSNVDNLGATLDPAVIGAHLRSGGEMTVELVSKMAGDKGGAPAVVDGRLQIVEDFRFPEGFDQDSIPVFNTNTFVFDARALDREFPLTWFAVEKKVGGAPVIQFERLAGELSSHLDVRWLLVPRTGPLSRFLPVKDPEELDRRRPEIRAVLATRGVTP